MKKAVDAATTRAAVEAIAEWIQRPEDTEKPGRAALALATRSTARTLEADAPGHSVEPVSYTHLTLPTICSV